MGSVATPPFQAHRPSSAQCLRDRKNEIIAEWVKRARAELPAAQGQNHYLLINSLPLFLDELIASLEIAEPRMAAASQIAEGHAMQRSRIADYNLKQVLVEYRILRQVLFEFLDHGANITNRDRDIILDLIQNGKSVAAERYAERAIVRETQISHALRQTEERLTLALESANMGVWDWDLRTGKLNWSDRILAFWAYNPWDFHGKVEDFWARILPEDREQVDKATRDAIQNRQSYEIQFRVTWPDGSIHWIACKGRANYDLFGKVVRMAGVATEITERVEERQKLKDSEELFRLASQATQDLIWDWNLTTNEIRWNEWAWKRLGFTEPLTTTTIEWWADHLHPNDVDRIFKSIHNVIDRGGEHWTDDYRFRKADGHYISVRDRGYVVRDGSGKPVRMIGAMQDVTAQRNATEAIRISEQSFRTLANSMPQIVWTADPEGTATWFNDWWYDYTGAPPGTVWDAANSPMHPEDAVPTRLAWCHSMKTGEIFEKEIRFRRASDNEYRWHLGRAVPLRDKNGKILKWIGTNTDVHDQKILLAKLQATQKHLEAALEMRERFASTLTHDLRTPLTAARINIHMASKKAHDPEAVQKYCAKTVESLYRADRMIQDLLDASLIKAGQPLSVKLSECDIAPLIRDVCHELATSTGATFEIQCPEKLIGYWSCPDLRRVIDNVGSNAVKYGDISRPIQINVVETEQIVEISVHNEGDPISKEDLPHIFEPFRRSSSNKGRPKGWGLGLSLVKGVTEAHGGRVEVESSESQGTTFRIILPKHSQNSHQQAS